MSIQGSMYFRSQRPFRKEALQKPTCLAMKAWAHHSDPQAQAVLSQVKNEK